MLKNICDLKEREYCSLPRVYLDFTSYSMRRNVSQCESDKPSRIGACADYRSSGEPGWHRGKTAELLGISPSTLYRRLREYDLETP
ncbi:MAG: helix-turn-helix domain-containing protein [Blastocatellia bacterium]|nr:helix-turn-helix domain-containing protein [Blastocatellia bacterium]